MRLGDGLKVGYGEHQSHGQVQSLFWLHLGICVGPITPPGVHVKILGQRSSIKMWMSPLIPAFLPETLFNGNFASMPSSTYLPTQIRPGFAKAVVRPLLGLEAFVVKLNSTTGNMRSSGAPSPTSLTNDCR